MKKVITILLLFCSFVSVANAQSASEAKKVLDKTAAIVGRSSGASANFSISSGKYATANGKIAIKGKMFHASTDNAIVWFNGKTQWTYMKKNNEVNVSNPSEAKQVAMNPYTFITMYRNGYDLGMTTVGNNYQVHMKAKNEKRNVQEMYIMIDKKTYIPHQVKVLQNNQWATIKISNFKSKNQPNSLFTFNAKDFPSAEVIDLR